MITSHMGRVVLERSGRSDSAGEGEEMAGDLRELN